MSARGSSAKRNGLPPTPPSGGHPGVRTSGSYVLEKYWKSLYDEDGPDRNAPGGGGSGRALAVYDAVPPGLGGKDYRSWANEWLPRLVEHGDADDGRPLRLVRNPVGFAIEPRRTTASRAPRLGPIVLRFSGKPERRGIQDEASAGRRARTRPVRRVYTGSAFRIDGGRRRGGAFDDGRPMSTRKELAERTPTSSSASRRLPDGAAGRERLAAILPDVRRDGGPLADDRRKYVVLTQSLSSSGNSSAGSHIVSGTPGKRAAGVVRDPPKGGPCVIRRGAVCRGHAWKPSDPPRREGDVFSPLLVRNSVIGPRSLDMVKVKDVMASRDSLTKTEPEPDKENEKPPEN